MAKVISTIKFRRNTAANWTSGNPILQSGEPGFETDTKKIKIGDGTTAWTLLPYTTDVGINMSSLDDVVITIPVADNELVAYDTSTSKWINQTAAEAGLALASHTHALSSITVTDIPTAADLNTYLTQGLYHQSLNAQAAAGTNYPAPYAGLLEVFSSGSMLYQRYTVYQGFAATYYRSRYVTTWGAWERLAESSDTTYVGTTAIALNRASASQSLTGVSIDGSAGTAGALSPGANINGVGFTGASGITIKASTTNVLTFGTHLTGTSFDGSAAVTLGTNATDANTVSTIVARNGSGNFSAGIITANNYKVNLTTAASDTVALDFTTGAGLITRAAAAAVTFTGANYSAGSTVTVRIVAGAAARAFTFPAGWVFVGSKPTQIAASKSGILTVTSFGTTEANCIASWVAQL